eukprot:3477921-Rhodomonas_salina.3
MPPDLVGKLLVVREFVLDDVSFQGTWTQLRLRQYRTRHVRRGTEARSPSSPRTLMIFSSRFITWKCHNLSQSRTRHSKSLP